MAIDLHLQDAREDINYIASHQNLFQDVANTERLKRVANASRQSAEVREALGQERVLDSLVRKLHDHELVARNRDLGEGILRCLGNAIVNNTLAVEFLIKDSLNWIRVYLRSADDAMRTLAVKVLYNICAVDFEDENPAWKKCFDEGLYLEIIQVLTASPPTDELVELKIDLLFWTTCPAASQGEGENKQAIHATGEEHRLWPLFNKPWFQACTKVLGEESLACLIESTITLCRAENVRQQIISQGKFFEVFLLFEVLDGRLFMLETQSIAVSGSQSNGADQTKPSPDDGTLLAPQASNLIWLMSDISADDKFGEAEDIHKPSLQHVLNILLNSGDSRVSDRRLQAACLVLGNTLLSLPDEQTVQLLEQSKLVESVSGAALRPKATPDLLHAVAGLIVVLSKPSMAVREVIAQNDQIEQVLSKLCQHGTPQIREAGIRALRALGKESPAVQQRFTALLRQSEVSLATSNAVAEDTVMADV